MAEQDNPGGCQNLGVVANPELDRFFGTLETALTLFKKEAKTDMRLARLISHNKQKRPSNGKDVQPPVPAEHAGKSEAAAPQPTAGPAAAPPSPPVEAAVDPIDKLRAEIRAQGLDSDTALQPIVERVRDLTQATGAIIALDRDQQVVCCASTGTAPSLGAVLQPTSGLSGQCLRAGEVVICQDSRRDSRVHPAVRETLEFRSALLAPVFCQGQSIGLVAVFSEAPHTFDYLHAATMLLVGELIRDVARGVAEPEPPAASADPPAQPEPEASAEPSESNPELDLLKQALELIGGEQSELPPPMVESASEPNPVEAPC
jgi:hypothetical protein